MTGTTTGKSGKVNSSAQDGVAVIPLDATPLVFDALYIGGSGDVVITNLAGNIATYTAVTGGQFFPVAGTRVMTATTATNIVTAVW